MTKKLLIVLALVIAVCALSINARVVPRDPRLDDIRQFLPAPSLDDGSGGAQSDMGTPSNGGRTMPLGVSRPNVNDSKGKSITTTWRDWMANGSINRNVAVNPPGNAFGTAVQFSYMYKSSKLNGTAYPYERTRWGWAAYDAVAGVYTPAQEVVQNNDPTSKEAGSYPRLVIDPQSGAAYFGSYDFPNAADNPNDIQLHMVFDLSAMSATFGDIGAGQRIPDSVAKPGNFEAATNSVIWPALAMTTAPNDTVLYLFAWESTSGQPIPGAAKVFRRDGTVNPTTGQYNPDVQWKLVFTDTATFPDLDIAGSTVSTKVAASWVRPTQAGLDNSDGRDNDIWYADSPHGLINTWTKHNVTNYTGDTYRANIEVSALYDTSDKLHLVWNAAVTQGTTHFRRGRIFHWSEWHAGNIYTVYNGEWDVTTVCGVAGNNMMTMGCVSIGECGGRLYTIFSAFDDPGLGSSGLDCAGTAYAPNTRSANGEVYVTISKDLEGKSWDHPRNLSQKESPDCDTNSTCSDDRWGCISTRGIDNATQPGNWSNADVEAKVIPGGVAYAGTAYTQVWYLQDRFPGGGILAAPEGVLTLNDYRWIRMACVPPITAALLATTPGVISYPTFGHPSTQKDITMTMENVGNDLLTMGTITKIHDSCKGPGCGPTAWFDVSGTPATIAEATSSTATLQLNKAGIITSGPTVLWGRIVFNYTTPAKADTLHIQYTVADTIQNFIWDSIATSCSIKLAVGNNGNMGNNYIGNLNMNFRPPVECDTGSAAPYVGRGDASIYLGDASPVIIRKLGSDSARGSWSIFSQGYDNPNGLKPLAVPAPAKFDTTVYQRFFSGQFLTVDSLVRIQKWWYAPKSSADSCQFIIEKMQVMPNPIGTAVTNLQIGEAFDWDIPSDSGNGTSTGGSANVTAFDAAHRLVYAKGYNSSDTTVDCWNNSLRLGGSALLSMHTKATYPCCAVRDTLIYGAYSGANDSFVYPAAGFVPNRTWTNMSIPGYVVEPRITDIHVVLTYKGGATGYTLPANDTLTVYTAMAVTRAAATAPATAGRDSLFKYIDKARKWSEWYVRGCKSCCLHRGDTNHNGTVNLADVSSLVNFLTGGGFIPPCNIETDVNNSGTTNLADISSLVNFLTGGGFTPPACT